MLLFMLLLGYWTIQLLIQDQPWIFLDYPNLLFHEAGHLVFGIFGSTMGILGGTLMQLLVPMLVVAEFARSRQWHGVGFGVWWLGENLVNVSVYMKDAREQALPLIGNGTHDWLLLFGQWGVLEQDQLIGGFVLFSGMVLMVVALGLMALALAMKRRLKI